MCFFFSDVKNKGRAVEGGGAAEGGFRHLLPAWFTMTPFNFAEITPPLHARPPPQLLPPPPRVGLRGAGIFKDLEYF